MTSSQPPREAPATRRSRAARSGATQSETDGGDRIELRGLRALGTHGALPEEQVRAQPFEVDLDVALDLAPAGASDDLGQTLDYGSLSERVASIVSTERVTLIERLAERIATAVLDDERVTEVAVTVRKLRPPVPVDLATAAVRIVRRR